ncbi:MAG: FadR/GntR family transcriptional regulator [Spirochaetales bacterium]
MGRTSDDVAAETQFQPRSRETAVDFVIGRVKDMLISGALRPGERLPPERELALQLGVSRGPLREAMKVLAALGVVKIVHGGGTYISSGPSEDVYNPLLFDLILTCPSKHELLDLRESVEIGLQRLALKNGSDEDFDYLESLNEHLRKLVAADADADEITAADLAFHTALGQAAHNRPLERIYGLVMEYLRPLVRETQSVAENGRNAVELHSAIIAALRRRDATAALRAFRRAIDHWAERFGRD